jgi:hypothetical protein
MFSMSSKYSQNNQNGSMAYENLESSENRANLANQPSSQLSKNQGKMDKNLFQRVNSKVLEGKSSRGGVEPKETQRYTKEVERRASLANQPLSFNKDQITVDRNLFQRINNKVLDRRNSKEAATAAAARAETKDPSKSIIRITKRKLSWEDSSDGDDKQSSPDRFFENFDSMYRVQEGIKEGATESATTTTAAKVCRTLQNDFESIYVETTRSSEHDDFIVSRKEKTMPHLDWDNSDTQPDKKAYESNTTKASRDHFKLEKLPDIKVMTSKPSSFSRLSNDGTNLFDKINRLHENFILKSRPVRVSTKSSFNPETVKNAVKMSEQTLQNILRTKKADNQLRSFTLNNDDSREASFRPNTSTRNDEIRSRVHSFQHIDENIRRKVLQKPDLSVEIEHDPKMKSILKGLEQKSVNHYFGLSRPRGHGNETCTSSRSLYHQENLSILSNNSFQERQFADFERRGTMGANILSTKNDDPFGIYEKVRSDKPKTENPEMINLYKGLKNNIRQKEYFENSSRGGSYLNPLKEVPKEVENRPLTKYRK